ncbi:hypothetical protein C8R47DRAFT_107146 [Mycena vitilis]|nr:hypothetical protein C8R47DRAFT_107146 [Mycena vitilis]
MLLEQWFVRAKGTPLSLTISSPRRGNFNVFVSLLSAAASQLSCLELDLDRVNFELLGKAGMQFPRLKTLAIPCDDHRHDYHPLSFFPHAPSLSTLTIRQDTGDLTTDLYPLLTTIELQYGSLDTVMSILQRFPRLSHLSAGLMLPEQCAHGTEQCAHHIVAPNLQSLVFRGGSVWSLPCFTLPGLHRLDVYTQHCTTVLTVLVDFIARSSCELEHLGISLTRGDDSMSDFVTCLNSVPDLISLTIDTVNVLYSYPFMQALRSDRLLPKLRTLTIVALYETFDFLAFIRLLQLRCVEKSPYFARLESVHLNLNPNLMSHWVKDHWLSQSFKEECAQLTAQGLRLRATLTTGNDRGTRTVRCVWPGEIDVRETFPWVS